MSELTGMTLADLRRKRTSLRGKIERRRGAILIASGEQRKASDELHDVEAAIASAVAAKKGNRP